MSDNSTHSASLHPLRREAHAFKWEELTQQQQRVIEKIAGLLANALVSLDSNGKERSPSAFHVRKSQLAFVDGDRGMGKTSVLLAIENLMRQDARPEGLPPELVSLHDKRRRFVWLETLDMEPLPRSANLLAAILARISEQAESPAHGPSARLAAAFDDLDEYERVACDLQQLTLDAVLAWQGTECGRAERIEPASYAEEVLTSERAGLKLNPRVDRVLRGLSKLASEKNRDGDPLFIIPVDDFDLAPTRCLELLRIIRMVTSSRLFFVIAGNTRVAETVLRLQSEGELAALAGAQMAQFEADHIRRSSIEIAANNLRKLVPPEQRATLDRVPCREALQFRIADTGPTLEGALQAITFDRNNAPTDRKPCSLAAFVSPNDPVEVIHYSAAGWLGGKPRQVLDRLALLCGMAGELTEQKSDALVKDLSKDLCQQALEDAHLELELRERFRTLVDPNRVRLGFAANFFADVEPTPYQIVEGENRRLFVEMPQTVNWSFVSTKDKRHAQENEAFRVVPAHLGVGLTFIHDLAITLWGGYVTPSAAFYGSSRFFRPISLGWGHERDRDSVIHWYAPQWWTIREFERFWQHWARHAVGLSSIHDHALAWLAAMLEVVMDEPIDRTSNGRSVERLRGLLNRLAAERPDRFARRHLRESVLVVVALLLAPESGCGTSLARRFLTPDLSFVSALGDAAVAKRIRRWRAITFAALLNQTRQRERVLGPTEVEPLARINRREAVDILMQRIESLTDRTYSRAASGPTESDSREPLRALVEDYRRDGDVFVAGLDNLGTPLQENAVPLVNALRSICVREREPYPIDQVCGGSLCPTHETIECYERQSELPSANP